MGSPRADRRREQAKEAEQAIIGCVLLAPVCWPDVESLLEPADFAAERHQRLWRWLQDRHVGRLDADVLVASTCDEVETFGGPSYVMRCADSVSTYESAQYYARLVAAEAQRRRLLDAAEAIRGAVEEHEDPAEALAMAERRLQALAGATAPQDFLPAIEVMAEQWKAYGERSQRKARGQCSGISTGYSDLDGVIGGMRPGELIILAARPSMGKTALALNISRNLASAGVGVAFCSQEMSRGQCLDRMLAAEMRLQATDLRDGVHASQRSTWDLMVEGAERVNRWRFWVSDSAGMKVSALASRVRRLHAREGLGLLVVDYLQIMGAEDRKAPREVQVATIATGLKRLAMELHIPVLAVAQLNRGVEGRRDKRPTMGDLRESGQIEQDADVIAFLYREDYYDAEKPGGTVEVIVEKNRNGSTGRVELAWASAWQRFDTVGGGGR